MTGSIDPPLRKEDSHSSQSVDERLYKVLGQERSQTVWAIGGGKGGVGKSLVTANTSSCLALMGHKVTTIDLDLGGANLHTCLGVPVPDRTLTDFLSKQVTNIQDIISTTSIPNLSIISGAQDELGIANLKQMHKNKILSHLGDIDADYILLDLGAGTTFNTLDFFLSSQRGILTVLPEPTSIENTYRFIKSIFYRKLKMSEELLDLGPLIERVMNAKVSTPHSTPVDLVKQIVELDPEKGARLQKELSKLRPSLIVNQVRTQADIDLGFSIRTICKRYFGIDVDYVGYLDYDSTVWQSVKKGRPLLMEFPNSRLVANFDRIVHRLLDLNFSEFDS